MWGGAVLNWHSRHDFSCEKSGSKFSQKICGALNPKNDDADLDAAFGGCHANP